MKKIYGLAALAAAMTLASCSNNDEPNNVGGEVAGETVTRYLAVNIMDDGTRAGEEESEGEGTTTPDKFDYGIAAENKVNEVMFILYDAAGTTGEIVNPVPKNWTDNNENTESVASSSDKVLVFTQRDQKPAYTQMLTILNPSTGIKSAVKDGDNVKSLADVKKIIGDYDGLTSEGTFVMSTAAYSNTYTTPIESSIKEDVNSALAAAVDVNVERVVSKIKLTDNLTADSYNAKSITLGNETTAKQVKLVIQSVQVGNVATTTPLIKNVDGLSEDWMTDATNKRSYWAKTPFSTESTETYTISYDALAAWDTYTADNKKTGDFYLHENTNQSKLTSVFVTAQLQVNGEAIDLVKLLRGGKYYTGDDGKEVLVNSMSAKYGWKNGSNVDALDPDDFEWTASDLGQSFACLKLSEAGAAKTLYVFDSNAWKPMSEVEGAQDAFDAFIASSACSALKWTNGASLYYVALGRDEMDGLVRNHVYDVTLESISGLGVPIFDPTSTPIKLEQPDPQYDNSKDWSLAATIKVLKWAKISQQVDFTKQDW